MNRFAAGLIIAGTLSVAFSAQPGYAESTYSRTVKRVWEDGFQLKADSRTLTVDSYDLYGDNTPSHITVGDQVIVRDEFEAVELDAFAIMSSTR